MSDPRVVLFDIDGTLINTGGAGARSWRAAFSDLFGVPGDISRFSELGQTDPVVAHSTFVGTLGREPRDDELARLIMGYLMRLPEEVANSTGYRLLPGVMALLDELARTGTLLGLVTGNVEGAAHLKLARAGLNRYFAFGGYGTDSADRGALTLTAIERAETLHGHPLDRSAVMVVGDTPLDVEAAHAVGAVAVAVATGVYTQETLRACGAEHVLENLETAFPEA